jgi:hypothetical protein
MKTPILMTLVTMMMFGMGCGTYIPKSDETAAKDTTADSPAKDTTADSPAKDTTADSPAKKATVDSPAKKATVDSPAKKATADSPAKKATADSPAKKATVDSPAKDTTVEPPAKKATVDSVEPVSETVVIPLPDMDEPGAVAVDTVETAKDAASVTDPVIAAVTEAPVDSVESVPEPKGSEIVTEETARVPKLDPACTEDHIPGSIEHLVHLMIAEETARWRLRVLEE